jgi:predicted dehydrogenase
MCYKAVIIGCGKIAGCEPSAGAETHAGAYAKNECIEIVGCVDQNVDRLRNFAIKYKCTPHISIIDALVVHTPDIISICTPDHTHFNITKQVLEHPLSPKLVFLEKPMCKTISEYKILCKLATKSKTFLVINHTRKFCPKFAYLRNRITDGEFGALFQVTGTYYSGWYHNGTHIIDTLSYLLNDSVQISEIIGVIDSPYSGDPTLEIKGRFKVNKSVVIVSGIDEDIYQLFELDFWFEKGRLRVEDFGKKIIFEQQVVNEIGERVLESKKMELPQNEQTTMEYAIDRICNYLTTCDATPLYEVSILGIKNTMETLWQATRIHQQMIKS